MLSSLKKKKLPKVRLGESYQAELPALLSEKERRRDLGLSSGREGIRVWPGRTALDGKEEMESYLDQSRDKKYNTEQALPLLAWHKLDLAAAQSDLGKFTPIPDTWSLQEKEDFAHALEIHGKDFEILKKVLPLKSMRELVKYYYSRERLIHKQ